MVTFGEDCREERDRIKRWLDEELVGRRAWEAVVDWTATARGSQVGVVMYAAPDGSGADFVIMRSTDGRLYTDDIGEDRADKTGKRSAQAMELAESWRRWQETAEGASA